MINASSGTGVRSRKAVIREMMQRVIARVVRVFFFCWADTVVCFVYGDGSNPDVWLAVL